MLKANSALHHHIYIGYSPKKFSNTITAIKSSCKIKEFFKMNNVIAIMVIFITAHYKLLCDGVKTECVVENGSDPTVLCVSPELSVTNCHSLNDLPSLLNASETEVVFCSPLFTLHFNLALQGVHNVSLVGNPSTFTCSKDAGLTILDSASISMRDITFQNCGVLHNSTTVDIDDSSILLFRSALYIFNSTDITLESVTVNYTNGLGLTFFDTDGNNEIKNCTFANNSINLNETKVIPGGGGVYIEFTYCLPGQYGEECDRHSNITGSIYRFDRCKFIGNNATSTNRERTDFAISEGSNFYGLGRGGGLNIVFRGAAANNSVILNGCQFVENSGVWGGGLKVTFRDMVSSNSFTAHECVFESNKCINRAGGGADIGYSYYSPPYPHDNKMKFSNCNFTKNIAKFGGGIAFYSSGGSPENLSNIIEFDSCIWTNNKARFGSAVDISTHAWTTFVSGYLPSPKFRDSVFLENYVIHKRYDYEMFSLYKKGNAAFLSTEFTINFFGTVNFTNNNGSALFLVSSVAIFEPYTDVTFHNNSGFNGGAIALIGFSVLILNDNMHFLLSNNTAVRCGGAIYSHSIDKHDYISSRSCFIHNSKVYKNEKWINSSVTFINNTAGAVGTNTLFCGHSISATTLLPCYYACKKSTAEDKVTVEEAFTCYANFTFLNSSRPYELITSGANFTFAESNETIKLVPSKEEPLPVGLIDDLEQNVNAEIFLDITMGDGKQNIQLDHSYAFLSDNKTVLYGEPGSEAFLTLSKTSVRENAITLKFKVEQCPPGYINKDNHCVCSVGSKEFYSPVYACNHTEFVAISRHGYWIGYVDDEATEDNLIYGYCPSRRCFNHSEHHRTHHLTKRASKNDLDRLVCGSEATGILCSSCREGYSINYHSGDYTCSNKSCKLGWLYYFISELLPITVLFVVVIFLNISFVTGELNGFIFFAQTIDIVSFSARGFIWIPTQPKTAIKIARLFYRFFNFDFFRLNELSFCLWNGANSLDMLAFKYVTVAYASLLIVLTIWLMNKCNLYQRIYCLRASKMRASITHGLSAFLIMVYAQCATVSLKILDFSYLHSKGHVYNRTVVTYQGDIEYFHTQHLPYAIPALLCVMTVVILPAVILLCYPSCFKVVSFFHLGENKCVSWLLQKIPHAFLKPFVDSFQSCFKDNLRFFAGLYFVYRLMLLTSWIIPSLLTQQFMLLELLFVFMLLVHSVFQPYKKRWHNVLDALIFFILSVINGITVYNYHYSKLGFADKIGVNVLVHIQIFLAYLPLVYFVIFTVYSLVNKIKNIRKLKTSSLTIQLQQLMKRSESDDELPSRLGDNKDVQESDEDADKYHIYNENASIGDTY